MNSRDTSGSGGSYLGFMAFVVTMLLIAFVLVVAGTIVYWPV